jgi:hypothetical protein
MFATPPDLEIRTHTSAVFDCNANESADAATIEYLEGIVREDPFLDI